MLMKTKLSLLALLFTVILSSCGSKGSTEENNDGKGSSKLTGEIRIDGSSTVYPITEAVAEEFRTQQADVKVTVGVSGTGGGFKKFGRGEIDINDASRPIKDKEDSLCKASNINYIQLKVAFDGLVVVVNKENTWVNDLTVEDLKKMWEPGAQEKITKWNQIRKEWPATEFKLYGPGVASGTYDYFTEAIVGKSGSSRGDYTASEDDNVLVQGISGDKNGIGFFGLAYYQENADKLKLIPINNGKGAVLPSVETVKDGTYAPLSRPVFIYVTDSASKRAEVAEFVKFYLGNASSLVPDVGYIPLTNEEYTSEAAKFNDFVTVK